MPWKDRYREASFRGVAFKVDSHEVEGGRRGETYEYPQRDEPYAEDLGRRARRYNIDAYLVGPDYDRARDQLLDALEAAGPANLVHPYLGTRRVQVRDFRIRESTRDGGLAVFRITFDEAGQNQAPAASVDTASAVDAAASSAATAAQAAATSGLLAGAPGWITAAAAVLVVAAADGFDAALTQVTAVSGDRDALRRDTAQLRTGASSSVLAPAQLASDVFGLATSLRLLPSSPREAFDALLSIGTFDPVRGDIPATTPTRLRQAENERILLGLVRRSGLIEAARSAPSLPFDSRDEAVATRDQITDALDEEILLAGDAGEDDVFQELGTLLATVSADLTERGASLRRIQRLTLPATTPALVVSHRLYQDASLDQEIVARNRVRHPGFVPGGVELEVLTDAG